MAVYSASEERLTLLTEYEGFVSRTPPVTASMPLRLHAQESGRRLDVEVFGVIDQPFFRVASALSSPASVCDFLLLNLNVKSCVYRRNENDASLKIYVSGKSYAPPFRSITIEPTHQVVRQNGDYVAMTLSAQKGLMGSSDYQVLTQAVPYQGKTLLRLSSAYQGSRVSRLMTQTYLRTFGRDKVGFSIVGQAVDGDPLYVKGLQGVIERNVVRSYFALQAHLQNESPNRFEQRIRSWYGMTETHARQLREIEREEYFRNKRREYSNQLRLQAKLNQRIDINMGMGQSPALGQGFNAVLATEQ
jgi:hypothetical protein